MIKNILRIIISIIMVISMITTAIYLGWFIIFAAEDRSIVETLSYIPKVVNIIGLVSIVTAFITWIIHYTDEDDSDKPHYNL